MKPAPFAYLRPGTLADAVSALAGDPGAKVLPYTLSGGTDNKSLSRLGITGYGFAPLMLPDTSVNTSEDGQPAVSTVVVQKYNGKGYDTVESFE